MLSVLGVSPYCPPFLYGLVFLQNYFYHKWRAFSLSRSLFFYSTNILGELKGKKLKTARGWALKEAIRGLWKCSTEKEGQVFFEEWYSWAMRSRLEPVKKVARMMKRHLPNIVSYFRHRITNAALEGINNKIQSLIKKAYGYRNTDRFKTDILFHCGGLNLYPEICQ